MIHSNKGLSAVVTTLIIILLSLVAIGIIWVVVNNVLERGSDQIQLSEQCRPISIKATAVSCDGECNVTYNRVSGGDDVAGIKIIMSDGQNSNQTDVEGNVEIGTHTRTNVSIGGLTTPNSAQIAAYLIDSSGDEYICPPSQAFEFS